MVLKELPDGTLLETIDTSCLEKGLPGHLPAGKRAGNSAEMEMVPVTCLGMQEMGMCALIVREQRQRLIGII
jgi:hypothetical protein